MTQYGFFFYQSRCIDCKTCAVACKSWNNLDPGPTKWLRMFSWEKGSFPNTELHTLFAPCYHCEDPICIDACPFGAIYKEPEYGAVLVDQDRCQPGCRLCWVACPYGAPQFDGDDPNSKMSMCTMCIDRLEQGDKPLCVLSCYMRALDFGPFDDIQANYGELKALPEMPSHETTWPAIVFRPRKEQTRLVPYDDEEALRLMARRDELPRIYQSTEDVTDIPGGMVGRDKLVMKPRDEEELMYYTRNDQG
jgi:anaerobic dimethyl sulfoxide reductase subunit B (iron-sulfur subunit)